MAKKTHLSVRLTGTIILVGLIIFASFVFYARKTDKLDEGWKELSNLNPFKTAEPQDSGGPDSQETPSKPEQVDVSVSETSPEPAEPDPDLIGRLDIVNAVPSLKTWWRAQIIHRPEASENYEGDGGYDSTYSALFDSSGQNSKIISNLSNRELDLDSRPTASKSIIYLELSLHSSSGNPITVSSTNWLQFSFPLEEKYGYVFRDRTLTLRQYDPTDPDRGFPKYNVRDVIENNNGIINLENLDGTYNSEVPYAYFQLRFI